MNDSTAVDHVATEGQCIRNWYCAHTASGKERRLDEALRRLGIETYLPFFLRQKSRVVNRFVEASRQYKAVEQRYDVDSVLFPGYLFARLDDHAWAATKTRLGVMYRPRWVDLGSGPIALSREEITSAVETATAPVRPRKPQSAYHAGEHVEVIDGPLVGLTGVCSYTAEERVFILLRMLGRESLVGFAPSSIMPLSYAD